MKGDKASNGDGAKTADVIVPNKKDEVKGATGDHGARGKLLDTTSVTVTSMALVGLSLGDEVDPVWQTKGAHFNRIHA